MQTWSTWAGVRAWAFGAAITAMSQQSKHIGWPPWFRRFLVRLVQIRQSFWRPGSQRREQNPHVVSSRPSRMISIRREWRITVQCTPTVRSVPWPGSGTSLYFADDRNVRLQRRTPLLEAARSRRSWNHPWSFIASMIAYAAVSERSDSPTTVTLIEGWTPTGTVSPSGNRGAAGQFISHDEYCRHASVPEARHPHAGLKELRRAGRARGATCGRSAPNPLSPLRAMCSRFTKSIPPQRRAGAAALGKPHRPPWHVWHFHRPPPYLHKPAFG